MIGVNTGKTSFYSEEELSQIGFKYIGENVKVSRKASIYSPEKISIGDNVRIDDFCILSGEIVLGSNIHISPYVALYGALGIEFEDYTGISAHSVVYSAMDDFGGDYLVGSIHPDSQTNVTGGKVLIRRFSQIGVNCVVFPNLSLGEGVAIGACTLVNRSLEEWEIYAGIPARRLKNRNKGMLKFVESDKTNY